MDMVAAISSRHDDETRMVLSQNHRVGEGGTLLLRGEVIFLDRFRWVF